MAFFSFAVDAVLLCFAIQPVQIAVEWLRQGSSLLWLRAEYFLSFAAENRKLYCGGCMKVAKGMVLWRQFVLHFGADDFPSEIPFKKRF